MNFGNEFTVLSATAGADKKGKKDDVFLTRKQWALVLGAALLLAAAIELFLRHSGL
jgi:hypothetical protein